MGAVGSAGTAVAAGWRSGRVAGRVGPRGRSPIEGGVAAFSASSSSSAGFRRDVARGSAAGGGPGPARGSSRLRALLGSLPSRTARFFDRPWNRWTWRALALGGGYFVGESIQNASGADGTNDVAIATAVLLAFEAISRQFYERSTVTGRRKHPEFLWDLLNVFKVGFSYVLILEAFKIGS